jgi:hypothetical protein
MGRQKDLRVLSLLSSPSSLKPGPLQRSIDRRVPFGVGVPRSFSVAARPFNVLILLACSSAGVGLMRGDRGQMWIVSCSAAQPLHKTQH